MEAEIALLKVKINDLQIKLNNSVTKKEFLFLQTKVKELQQTLETLHTRMGDQPCSCGWCC
jgi:hypothetical protein